MSRSLVCILAAALSVLLGAPVLAQEPAPVAKLPFSPVRQAGGFLFVSGQLPRTPEGKEVRDSVEAETRQVMENLKRLLTENGYSLEDAVSCTVYLNTMQDYQAMNKVYASYFKGIYPTRACVGGVELAFGFKVEISCVAYREAK